MNLRTGITITALMSLTITIGSFAVFAQSMPVKPAPVITRTLIVGVRGDDVKLLQEYLAQDKAIYPEGLITGYFGKLTEAAVKRFQTKYNIESVGIVGPKTRAKLKELSMASLPQTTEAAPAPSPEPVQPTPLPTPAPTTSIKTGTGIVANNGYINIGPIQFLYAGGYGYQGRGYIFPGTPTDSVADQTASGFSPCEEINAVSYNSISNICQFTNPADYTFTEHKEAVRIYDKDSKIVNPSSNTVTACYRGILLFKQGNAYGAIDPEDIDIESKLHYSYWYDESGTGNFSNLCASPQK